MTSPDEFVLWSDYLAESDAGALLGYVDGGVDTGGRGPGNFLPDVFPAALQMLRFGFGADPEGDPDVWGWTDTTSDALWDAGVRIRIGEPDEAIGLQPAEFAVTIRNDQPGGGDYTIGNPFGRWWPNIRENTPVQALLDIGAGESLRFQGYATQWKPVWDVNRRYAVVKFQAHGSLRRLSQGQTAKQSAMWRFNMLAHRFPRNTNGGGDFGLNLPQFEDSGQGYHAPPVHYWPLEETSGALQASNAVLTGYPLKASSAAALPDFASRTVGLGSKPIAVFGSGDSVQVRFPAVAPGADTTGLFPTSTTICVPFLMHLPALPGAAVEVMRLTTTGSAAQYRLIFDPSGGILSLLLNAYDASGTVLGTMFAFDDTEALDAPVWVILRLEQQGADVLVEIDYSAHLPSLETGASVATAVFNAQTVSSKTLGNLVGITIAPGSNLPDVAIGHLGVYNGGLGAFPSTRPRAVLGRRGDTATARLKRACIEDGVTLELVGTSDALMGPQVVGGIVDIAGEVRTVDGGVLLDGLGPGLHYICRTEIYSRPAAVTLDASQGMILGPQQPAQDDQGRVNRFTATSQYGGEATFTKVDGELGTDDVGVYDDSAQIPVSADAALYDQAAWRVHQGTAGGRRLRYPELTFHLEKPSTAPLAQRWLDAGPAARIDILALETGVRPDRSFLNRGWTEHWNSKVWDVTPNLVDFRAWTVGVAAADTGDDGEFICHLDTDGSTLAATIAFTEFASDGFELGTSNWSPQSGWTIGPDQTHVRSGRYAMRLTPPGAASFGGALMARTPATAGAVYVAEAWFFSEAGWSDARAGIDWYDAAGAFISQSLGSATVVPAGVWTVSRQLFTAPAGTVTAQLRARQAGTPAASDVLWVDDAGIGPQLQIATPSGPRWVDSTIATYADDIDGLVIEIDGLPVAVTGITGTTSPQTFTVVPSGIRKPLAAGAPVAVWDPPILGL